MSDAPIIPKFDDDSAGDGGRKLCIICSKGNLDMAYPGLILANAALGEGIEVHLFFTFWGLDIVNVNTMNNLKFTMVGNTAMHMPQLAKLGLQNMSMPQFMGNVPGMTAVATTMMKKMIGDLGVPDVPEMLQQVSDMGAQIWACKMSVDLMNLKDSDFHPSVQAVINASDFIEKSAGAQLLFI